MPQTGKWVDGLAASMANPLVETLEAPVALHPGRPVVVAAHVRGLVDARAKDGSSVLSSALDVELQGAVPTLGAPVTDGSGGVVGVFVKACQATLPVVAPSTGAAPLSTPAPAPPPPPPCVPLVVAAPVAAIRDFLSHTPPTAVTPTPWLGINGVPDTESNTHGVRVVAVAPDSPAQKGGSRRARTARRPTSSSRSTDSRSTPRSTWPRSSGATPSARASSSCSCSGASFTRRPSFFAPRPDRAMTEGLEKRAKVGPGRTMRLTPPHMGCDHSSHAHGKRPVPDSG